MITDGLILLIALAPALAFVGIVACAIAYQPPAQPPQCPAHDDDCAGGCPDLPVAAAEFAAHGYTDFDHWRAA